MRRARTFWIAALAIAATATVAGLWFVTVEVRQLEARQAQSQADFARSESIRLALWRMDSWMTPRLAREAARPPAEYASFFSPSGAVNRLLQSVPKGEVLSPSPLLLEAPDWIPIHFEWRADGTLTSPQVPEGNLLDLAEGNYLRDGALVGRQESLKKLAELLGQSKQSIEACAVQAELSNATITQAWRDESQLGVTARQQLDTMVEPAPLKKESAGAKSKLSSAADQKRAIDDYETRARASNEAQEVVQTASQVEAQSREQAQVQTEIAQRASQMLGLGDSVAPIDELALTDGSVGPLVATWLSTSPPELAFVRRVREHGETRVQGFLVDWHSLATKLTSQVGDLVSKAHLEPVESSSATFAPMRLASIPAELHGEVLIAGPPTSSSSATPALAFAWMTALLALCGGAVAAAVGISFGDRQARFASSVTHELRTPLTTFQLYAEMLRDGMVADPARRQDCLETLCKESLRLSHLVENVLSLSRLERGVRTRGEPSMISGTDLEQIAQTIASERTTSAAWTVRCDVAQRGVRVDHDAVAQILANLVENAAKYGRCDDGAAKIDISISAEGDALVIRVRDEGPGIPARAQHAIWRPFDRAGAEGGAQPGLGLGLTVSLALAKSMGGSLVLVRQGGRNVGACFELRVPDAIRGMESTGSTRSVTSRG